MNFPGLTPLQFLVLHLLFSGEKSGTELRNALRDLGIVRSAGAFSRLIRRLQWKVYLEVKYDRPVPGSYPLRECRFAVTDYGVMAWNATREFHVNLSPPPPELVPIPTEAGELAHYPPKVRNAILRRRAVKEIREIFRPRLRS